MNARKTLLQTGDQLLTVGLQFAPFSGRKACGVRKRRRRPHDDGGSVKQRKAMVAAISGLGVVVVTATAVGFDLAVVNAGRSPDRTSSRPTSTAAATPATEWVQLRLSAPGGLHDFTIKLHRGQIRLGIG
jgi:hypothetical protein